MKLAFKSLILAITIFIAAVFVPATIYGESDQGDNFYLITEQQFQWDYDQQGGFSAPGAVVPSSDEWVSYDSRQPLPPKRQDTNSAWFRFKLPEFGKIKPAVYMNPVYGQNIAIFIDNSKILELNRNYMYDSHSILLPLEQGDGGKYMYVHIQSEKNRIGMKDAVVTGEFQTLFKHYVRTNIEDIVLGSSFVFIALIMFLCALFLRRGQRISWITLSLVILSVGALILTYSPILYSLYEAHGRLLITIFDTALYVLLPALTLFFEKTVGIGYKKIIRNFRKFQVLYSLFCIGFMVVNLASDNRLYETYYFFTVQIMGYLMLLQLVLLVGSAVAYAVKNNRDAIIFATGFILFAIVGTAELIHFYISKGDYQLYWWKWGVFVFVIALIVILGRKFAMSHQQIVTYSQKLEVFNNELQRSEKMEIISELAASVAHEVRNPLQVTKGFLQLLQEKSSEKEKEYLAFALDELGRASNIITDFLTFAKPEIEKITILDISEEFRHIEGILIPLANFEGGKIVSNIPPNLRVKGNSSKFKQAFINLIKNGIEALDGGGVIQIWAYTEVEEVVIHIQDNGEGMEPEELERLGEPYFSNKIKGTGLGLVVTFRIIEGMQGRIQFKSERGIGTEVIIRFPNAQLGSSIEP